MNINKHEMSDDELDRLFSESAEKMEFGFDPESWTKMSQKLDAASPPLSSSRGMHPWFKRSVWLLIGLLAFVGGYFLLKLSTSPIVDLTQKAESEQSEINSKKRIKTPKVNTDNLKTEEKATETPQNNESNKVNITTKESGISSKNDANFGTKNSTESNKSIEKEKVALSTKTIEKSLKSDKNNDFLAKNNKIQKKSNDRVLVKKAKQRSINTNLSKSFIETNSNNSLVETNVFSSRNTLSKSKKQTNNSQTFNKSDNNGSSASLDDNIQISNLLPTNTTIEENRLTLNNLDLLSPKGTFIKSNISLPVIAFESPEKEAPIVPKSSPQSFKKGLYFRFGISPDLSLVTMDELTKAGSNLAFLAEYRFNNRLSIQAGVLRSMKYYDTYPESYEWPSNWGYMPKMTNINATCKMLDIPLNIRYDISQKKLSRIFVSAGATTYIMLNEKYVYNYENPADPMIKWKAWEGKTGPLYLGVINFSVGFEHQLFRKLSIQAEPFFKLPITNVGFGKVHLSTLGLLLSAKYPIFTHK